MPATGTKLPQLRRPVPDTGRMQPTELGRNLIDRTQRQKWLHELTEGVSDEFRGELCANLLVMVARMRKAKVHHKEIGQRILHEVEAAIQEIPRG